MPLRTERLHRSGGYWLDTPISPRRTDGFLARQFRSRFNAGAEEATCWLSERWLNFASAVALFARQVGHWRRGPKARLKFPAALLTVMRLLSAPSLRQSSPHFLVCRGHAIKGKVLNNSA